MLEIRLLGSYEVRRDGAAVGIASRPARLLLAYLALSAGTPHPRERVAGILWPDSDENSARGNLRQALWRLRKAIGSRYLPADNQVVAFEGGSECSLDTELLEDPSDRDLLAAVSAYRGELLPGFYEDWVLLERGRLQAAFERKIQLLLDSLVQKQEWLEVLKWAEHWIAYGQVPEPAYRVLMIAHAAQGDLAAVASVFERCVSALQLEVGVDPSEETRTLYDNLIHREGPAAYDRIMPEPSESRPVPRHNLPQQINPLIGRERELAEARQLLSASRLLTILGPGGMGKTRLALELAGQMIDQFRNGVYFVSLAPIGSASYLIQTIAEAIGFPLSTDEEPKRQLLRHFRNRQYLLLIDNFEHLLEGAEFVAEILQSAGDVTILTTSRERLNLQEESLLRIDGLAYPRSPAERAVTDYDAIRLFMDSAHRLRPGFALSPADVPEVTRICQMVQGMPLGILLAAAWVDTLSPAEIAGEMSRSLDFLQNEWRDAPERHRSARAAFESSWRRLTKNQRQLLANLAVFRGSFSSEAAQEVTGASLLGLANLVQKSLIRRDLDSSRYEIHELLRQFSWERLGTNRELRKDVAEAHAVYFADYMAQRWANLTDSRQLAAMNEIQDDLENVRRAWRYWLKRRDDRRIRQFLDSFWRFYEIRGWFNAAATLFADAAEAVRTALSEGVDADSVGSYEAVYARALAHQANFLAHLGITDRGLVLAQESVTIVQRLGWLEELSLPLTALRWNAQYAGTRAMISDISWESLEVARKHSSEWMQAYVLTWQAREVSLLPENETAQRLVEEGKRIFEERGDIIASVWPGMILGDLAITRGAYDEAKQLYERVLLACEERDFRWGRVKVTRYLGIVATLMGDYELAKVYLRQSLVLADDLGLPRDVYNVLYELSLVEAASGDGATAVWLLALIQDHPLGDQIRSLSLWTDDSQGSFRELAKKLLADLKSRLPPRTFAMAIEHGRASTLDSVVLELLRTQWT